MNAIEKKIAKIVTPALKKNPNIIQAWSYIKIYDSGSCFDIGGDYGINDEHWSDMSNIRVSETSETLDDLKESFENDKQYFLVKKECMEKIEELRRLIFSTEEDAQLKANNCFWEAIEDDLNCLTAELEGLYPWRYIDALYLEVKKSDDDIEVTLKEYVQGRGIID